ncbi:MAG TPA: ATP-binding cassette domain-containing protein [Candidatus Ornithoclostridium excrementipullorum]|nr:ATP-binding cassette domain-containing protein [Candidatus Ornithoclostridium excrementipullorum]
MTMTEIADEKILQVRVSSLEMSYFGGATAVKNWSFSLGRGEKLCIFGMHNQGKTALLRTLAGLEEYGGSILVDGKEVRDIPPREIPIAFSFDLGSLQRHKTALKNIVRPLMLRKCDSKYIAKRLAYVTRLFDIEDLLNVKIKELTPLQTGKVLLARIFVRECSLYLIDDVFSGMGYTARREAFEALTRAAGKCGGAVIYATDRMYEAREFGGKISVVYAGMPRQIDEYYRLYRDPLSLAVVEGLDDHVGIVPGLLKKDERGYRASLFGEKSVAAPTPISDTYVNKQVLFCVYPNDVEAKRSDEGAWVADRSVSTKDGRIVRLVREDGVVFVQDPDLAEGERADAEIKAVGNYFDKISEFKINC